MFADQIAGAIAAAPLHALDDLSRSIWKGLGEGVLTDDDAQRLAEAIHARKAAGRPPEAVRGGPRPVGTLFTPRRPQRAPVRPVAIERRRRLAASGPLPPQLAARFTMGEVAVLRIVADEVRERGACDLCLDAIAAKAGVCRSTAKNALRRAAAEEMVVIIERRRPGQKNLPNTVRIISREWKAWIARGPRSKAIGVKKVTPTDTQGSFREEEREGRAAHNREEQRSGDGKEGRRAMR